MAISLKTDGDYGYGLLPLFGVSPDITNTAKGLGITVTQSSPGTFVVRDEEKVYGSISVKGSAISLAKSKTLGPASKEALKFQFETALTKAIKANVGKVSDSKPISMYGNTYVDDKDLVVPDKAHILVKPFQFAAKPKMGAFSPPVPKKVFGQKFSKEGAGPLATASSVYDPVTGTTAGSVYFVLARLVGLNVAARVQGQKLSLRAEGSSLNGYAEALGDLGMDLKGGYSSGHYEVADQGLMIKTLGALVGRLGFGAVTEMADIETFIAGQS